MGSYEQKLVGDLCKAYLPEPELLARHDMGALYQKRALKRCETYPLSKTVAILRYLGAIAYDRIAKQPRMWEEPVLLQTVSFSAVNAPILWAKNGEQQPLKGRYLEVVYTGSKNTMLSLDKNLAEVARRLADYPKELPPHVIGISNRDMTSAVTRQLDVPVYRVSGYFEEETANSLMVADIARELRGHPPLPDRKMYAVMLPTQDFIDRFTCT